MRNKKAFVLMELLVAAAVFILLLTAFLMALSILNKNLVQSHKKLDRTQAIKNQIEILKTKSFDQLLADPTQGLTVKLIKPDLKEAALTTLNEKWVWRLSR